MVKYFFASTQREKIRSSMSKQHYAENFEFLQSYWTLESCSFDMKLLHRNNLKFY